MSRSDDLFERARRVIPGGVDSPVRAYGAVGGTPRFIASASGARVRDADGNDLIDLVCSWGAIILGHADPRVSAAIARAASRGASFGAATEAEVQLAERLVSAFPHAEQARLVSSGTEATMTAIRVARGVTGRDTVVKFDGCYHGHSDALLVRAGSGVATLGMPGSAGVTAGAVADTAVAPYGDLTALDEVLEQASRGVAAIIVEPVAANMGVVAPPDGFLEGLRARCDRAGALLIFDEVITGFRIAYGPAPNGVTPDLTCLGKVIGGGLPIGALVGPTEVMSALAPTGPVYQAGTLSGNPVAVAAGLAVLDALRADPPYARMERAARALTDALGHAAEAAGIPLVVAREGSLFSPFFRAEAVRSFEEARAQDTPTFSRFFHAMAARGVHLPPSSFEAWFLSDAHGATEVGVLREAIDGAMREAARKERGRPKAAS